jgi:hypothetical protein
LRRGYTYVKQLKLLSTWLRNFASAVEWIRLILFDLFSFSLFSFSYTDAEAEYSSQIAQPRFGLVKRG